uniref:Uncharacterized protein n=1 Tax=Parascaris univalens TaxID=6257 RepID=A0A915B5X5_PARUN
IMNAIGHLCCNEHMSFSHLYIFRGRQRFGEGSLPSSSSRMSWTCPLSDNLLAFVFSLLLPVSLLSLCFFKRQRYVLVKDANIPQSQDLPQNVTPEPAEGWGDKNDDTLRDVKTLTRSESFEPPCDAAGNYIDLQSALDGQIARPPAAMNEGKVEKEIAEMKNDDEKAMQKMS